MIAGGDPANAAGLTQIVPQTGTSLLGMHINLAASRRLTDQIDRADSLGRAAAVAAARARRARRSTSASTRARRSPRRSATCSSPSRHFGRADLAVESYHMGIGNLSSVLDAYDGGRSVPYVQLYFDTAPDHHGAGLPAAVVVRRRLLDVLLARAGRRADHAACTATDRPALSRLAALQTSAGSAELGAPSAGPDAEHSPTPMRSTRPTRTARSCALPANPAALGLAYDPGMGSFASRLGVSRRSTAGCGPSRSTC